MLKASVFWEVERDAPLLILNHNFLESQGDGIFERVSHWPTLASLDTNTIKSPSSSSSSSSSSSGLPDVVNPDRIFVADAERTFKNAENRKQFVKLLAHLSSEFKDYAQGLGYVSSFFLLTMGEAQAIALLSHLNSQEKYIPGYWKHEAIPFATDAYVFQSLLERYNPDVAAHLVNNTVDPSTFCQKWFVGLCVHVLPLEYLFTFFEKFFVGGYRFLMRFGLSLIQNLQERLLEADSASSLFAILRLDPKSVPHDGLLYRNILSDTDKFDLSDVNFEGLREEMYNKHLKSRVESAHAILDDVEEIEDCSLCKDDFPEVHCVECNINVSTITHLYTEGNTKRGLAPRADDTYYHAR